MGDVNFELLERRYGPGFAQYLMEQIEKVKKSDASNENKFPEDRAIRAIEGVA